MRLQPPVTDRARGFTLVELMVVLVLIAVLTAVMIPEMRGTFEGEQLRASSRELIRGLSIAHSQSITVNHPHRLVIDAAQNRYRVERLARSSEEGGGFVPVRSVAGAEGALHQHITIELRPPPGVDGELELAGAAPMELRRSEADNASAPNSIRFFPDGTAEGAELHLRDRGGFGLALRLNPITARVRVVELERRRGS
jgi:type II secretion system protein H